MLTAVLISTTIGDRLRSISNNGRLLIMLKVTILTDELYHCLSFSPVVYFTTATFIGGDINTADFGDAQNSAMSIDQYANIGVMGNLRLRSLISSLSVCFSLRG